MAKSRVVLFHKPYGVLCQFSGGEGKTTLARFGLPAGVYPAGRLDHDSEGLLLLTDDGGLIHRLSRPGGHPRRYWAQIERVPDEKSLAALRSGVKLTDGKTMPCKAKLIEPPPLPERDPPIRHRLSVPTAWIELEMAEGKNRQVRRMTAAVGHPTLRLVRSQIAGLGIGSLAPGQWRWVERGELKP